MWNGLGNTPSLFQTVVLIDAACKLECFCVLNRIFPYFWLFFHLYCSIFSSYGNTFDLLLMFSFFMSAQEIPLWCPFPTDRTVLFPVERWKRRGPWGKKWTERCLFPARVGIFPFDKNYDSSTFPYLCLDLACKQLCFPPSKSINRRNESTFIFIKILQLWFLYFSLKSPSLTVWTVETLFPQI